MKRIFAVFLCVASQAPAMSGTMFPTLLPAAGFEKALEPFTMVIAGAILVVLGLAGRKRTV